MVNIKEFQLVFNNNRIPQLKIKNNITSNKGIYDNPIDIALLMNNIYELDQMFIEYAFVIGLNLNNKIIGILELSHGTTYNTIIPIKEMFIALLLMGVTRFVLVHNHPEDEEEIQLSQEDLQITEQIKFCSSYLEIEFSDHIIIATNALLSMKQENIL